VFFAPITGASQEQDERGFMSWFSTWNPIKDNLSKPLMEKIPNFEIRGYIQNTSSLGIYKNVNRDMNIPTYVEQEVFRVPMPPFPDWVGKISLEPYEGVGSPGMRHTDTSWQKIEWFVELEPRYRPTPNLQFVLKADFLYNSAFDWDDGFSRSYAESERKLNYYRNSRQILREWYVDYIEDPVQVRIGRQQVQWGKVDGRQILDMVHGVDYTRWPLGSSANPFFPPEYWRVPKFMTNLQYFTGDFEFQFLWIPDFQPSWVNWWPQIEYAPFQFNPPPASPLLMVTGGAPGMPQIIPKVTMDSLKKPGRNFENSEIGFMTKWFKAGWDVSLHYLWAWNDKPTNFNTFTMEPFQLKPPPAPPDVLPTWIRLQPEYKRLHKFGLGADRTWSMLGRQWAGKCEGRYVRDGFYRTADRMNHPKGYRRADSLLTGLHIETYILTDMTLILRWDHEQIFKYGTDLRNSAGSDQFRHQDGIFFTIRDPVSATYDRLVLISGLAYFDNGQWRWEPVITYELTPDCELMLGGHFFWGNPDQIFGQFSRYKGIDFGVKWDF
jgi:hypothetical protein